MHASIVNTFDIPLQVKFIGAPKIDGRDRTFSEKQINVWGSDHRETLAS